MNLHRLRGAAVLGLAGLLALAMPGSAAAKSPNVITVPDPGVGFRADLGTIRIDGIRSSATEEDPTHASDLEVSVSAPCSIARPADVVVDTKSGELAVTVTFGGAGKCALTVSDPGSISHLPANPASVEWVVRDRIVVAPAPVGASGRADGVASIVYGSEAPAFRAEIVEGLQPGDTPETVFATLPSCAVVGYAPGAHVGDYPVRCAGGVSAGTYPRIEYAEGGETERVLRVSPAPPPLVVAQSGVVPRSDGTPEVSYRVEGLVGADTLTAPPVCRAYTDSTKTTPASSFLELGSYVTACTGGAPSADYIGLSYADGALTVGERELVVTPIETYRAYGSDDLIGYLSSGWVLAEAWTTPPVCRAYLDTSFAAEVGPETPVGVYPTRCDGGAAGSEYSIRYDSGFMVIVPRTIIVEPDDATIAYGDADPDPGFSTGELAGLIGADRWTTAPLCSLAPTAGIRAAGEHPVTCDGGDAGPNYVLAYRTGTLTVEPRVLHLAAEPATKVYGDPDPAFGWRVLDDSAPLLPGDEISGTPSRNPGESVAGGPYRITAGTLGAGPDYTVRWESAALTITPAPAISYTPLDVTRGFGDPDPALRVSAQGFRGEDTWVTPPDCRSDRGAGDEIGRIDTISCSGGDAGPNYAGPALATGTATLTTTARVLVIEGTVSGKAYGDPDPVLAPLVASGTLLEGDELIGSLTRLPGELPGTYRIDASGLAVRGPNAAFYDLSYAGGAVVIFPRPLTLRAIPDSKVYDASQLSAVSPVLAEGTLVGGDALELATQVFVSPHAGDAVELRVGELRIVDPSGADVSERYAVRSIPATGSISPLTVSVRAVSDRKVYDGTAASTGAPTVEPANLPDAFTAAQSFADRDAGGTKRIIPELTIGDGSHGGDYRVELIEATGAIEPLTLTVRSVPERKVYDGSATSSERPLVSPEPIAGDRVTFGQSFASAEPGSAPMSLFGSVADGAGGANYRIVFEREATGTIEPVALRARADAADRPHDGTVIATISACSLEGPVVPGENVSCDISGARAVFESAGIGADKRVAISGLRLGGPDAAHYRLENADSLEASATIELGAQSIGFPVPAPFVFGESRPLAATASSGLPVSFAVEGPCTLEGGTLRADELGSCTVRATQAGSADWAPAAEVSVTIEVGPRPITVSASGHKIYGESEPEFELAVVEGSMLGADALRGTPVRRAGEAAGAYRIDIGTVAADAHYALTWKPGRFVVEPATLTVSPEATTRPYGDPDPEFTYRTVGFVGKDAWTTAPVCRGDIDPAAHVGASGTISCAAGDAGANYRVEYEPGHYAVVKRAVTVTIGSPTKLYGNGDPVVDYTLDPLLVGEDHFTGGFARERGEDAGEYRIVATDFELVSETPEDYELTIVPGRLTIAPRPLTVTTVADTKPYDGTDRSTKTPLVTGALVGDDTIRVSQRFASPHAGRAPLAIASLAVEDGRGGANYAITFQTTTAGVITPRHLVLAASPVRKVYDGTTTATGSARLVAGSLLPSDRAEFALRFETPDAGARYVLPLARFADPALAGDYVIDAIAATGTIERREVALSAIPDAKSFDGSVRSALTPRLGAACDAPGGLLCGHRAILAQVFDAPDAGRRTLSPRIRIIDAESRVLNANYRVLISTAEGEIRPPSSR